MQEASMSRPMIANADSKAAERRWMRAIDKRDGFRCRMERRIGAWVECGARPPKFDHAHIFPRRECAKAIFDEKGRTGIKSCRLCHNSLDGLGDGDKRIVRVPPVMQTLAAQVVFLNSNQTSQRIIDLLLERKLLKKSGSGRHVTYTKLGDWTAAE
jgi:hypothetical protein